MKLIFAFAVNDKDEFYDDFFGIAPYFMLYRLKDGKLSLYERIDNPVMEYNSSDLNKKSLLLTDYLKAFHVTSIVAQKFSNQLPLISQYFIPVITDLQDIHSAIDAINNKVNWLMEEADKKTKKHKLFYINSGIMKLNPEHIL